MKRKPKYKSVNDIDEKRKIENNLTIEKERRNKSRKRTRGPYRKASLRGRRMKL